MTSTSVPARVPIIVRSGLENVKCEALFSPWGEEAQADPLKVLAEGSLAGLDKAVGLWLLKQKSEIRWQKKTSRRSEVQK